MNIGIDIVENKRLENSNIKFIEKILTKEAIKKCLDINIDFNEIEILYDLNSKPTISYKNYKFSISISHERNYTVAIAILLK